MGAWPWPRTAEIEGRGMYLGGESTFRTLENASLNTKCISGKNIGSWGYSIWLPCFKFTRAIIENQQKHEGRGNLRALGQTRNPKQIISPEATASKEYTHAPLFSLLDTVTMVTEWVTSVSTDGIVSTFSKTRSCLFWKVGRILRKVHMLSNDPLVYVVMTASQVNAESIYFVSILS